ncbi:hypothetical protein FRC05_010128, partial [Tulasnella sp. 425]
PFSLKRSLHESDWERLILHSQYTKSLTISFDDHSQNQYEQLLSNMPSRAILPNLTSIHFRLLGGDEPPNSELIKLLLPTTVSFVEVEVPEVAEGSAEAVLDALAGVELPSLASFAIEIADFQASTRDLDSRMSQVLHTHQGIETLEINIYQYRTDEAICSAGRLPALRSLEVFSYGWEMAAGEPDIFSLPDNLFPVLHTLKLRGTPDSIKALSSRISSENLEIIDLYLEPSLDFEADSPAQNANCLLFSDRFPRLKTLVLHLQISVLEEALSPVLACRELETLRIGVGWSRTLWFSENTLARMGAAWPQLKTMDLTLFIDYHSNKYLGLTHLQVIARDFRSLVKLKVGFDATTKGNPGFKVEDAVTIADNELQELEVDWSLLDGIMERKIAHLFRAWWPKLRTVRCTEPLHFPYSYHWASVIEAFRNSNTEQTTLGGSVSHSA